MAAAGQRERYSIEIKEGRRRSTGGGQRGR